MRTLDAIISPDLYDTVRANFLQKKNHKELRRAVAIGAATMGAAATGAVVGGLGQAGAAAVGKGAGEAAKRGQ